MTGPIELRSRSATARRAGDPPDPPQGESGILDTKEVRRVLQNPDYARASTTR
jgi:hypothetical protein